MIRELSKKYKVSKTMLLYKMVKLGYIDIKKYEELIQNIQIVEKEGFIPPHKKCLLEKGEKFISLIEANLERGNITFDEALEYLEVKSRHYEKLLISVRRS